MTERWAALMKTEPPELDASTLMRAALVVLAIAAVAWLLRLLAQRRGLHAMRKGGLAADRALDSP